MIDGLYISGSWLAISAFLLLLAYLIRVREWTFLIAGYDDSLDLPRSVAASIVGNFLFLIGVAALGFGVIEAASTVGSNAFGLLYAAVVVIGSLRVMYRLNTHEGPSVPS